MKVKKLVLANQTGFCYGVRDAIKAIKDQSKNLSKGERIETLGPIIHNNEAIKEIEDTHSIRIIDSLSQIQEKRVAIRAHGAGPEVYEQLKKKDIQIIDTTCPFVLKTQKVGMSLLEEGYFVIILGKKNHPEVTAIKQYLNDKSLVIQTTDDLKFFPRRKKIGVIFQSTVTVDDFSSIIIHIINNSKEVKVNPTICGVTTRRQVEINSLAKKVDYMIIVGGNNSSNTKKLFQLSQKISPSIQIEKPSEVFNINFSSFDTIGLISGTSTSSSLLEKIIINIKTKIPNIKIINHDE